MSERLRVLVVEDNPAYLDLIREYMSDSGFNRFQIDSVSRLSEAIARLGGESFDLLLIDLILPDSQGLETFLNLRKAAPGTPSIILTGYDDEETAIAAVRNGAQDYLIKGEIIGNTLARAAQYALERKRMEVELSQAEENFRRSLDESPLGVCVVTVDGETIYANRAILNIYGYDNIEELKSTLMKNLYAPESYAEYQIRKKKRMNGEDYSSEYEISIIRKTGEICRLRVFRKEILWNGQKQFQAIYQDITEQKEAEDKLRETLSSLRKALGGIIQALSATTEKRDPYTAGHQKRVADLARAIGQEIGLSADRVEGLRLAGVIHDIGKMSIPAEMLSKPTRLTEIEYEMIKTHSQVGYDILRDIDFTWPLAEMVLQHHERMNGSGYPQRLKGDEILLEARILAVADVVEAMASHRPYRPALGIAAALEEIEKNKGILYDPDVVSACLTLFREKGFNLK